MGIARERRKIVVIIKNKIGYGKQTKVYRMIKHKCEGSNHTTLLLH